MAPGPIGIPVLRSTESTLDEPVTLGPAASERASEIIAEFQNRPDEIPNHNSRQDLASHERNWDAHEATGPAGDAGVPESVREVISSSGQSLDASIQRAMEDRMGDAFGDVRIHTGPKAANACEDINARAFTVGNHIAFNAGEYDPESAAGQHLLAHELAHVRQQTGGVVSMLSQEDLELEIDPDPEQEREAEVTAKRVVSGRELGIQRLANTEVYIQRFPWDQSNLNSSNGDGYDSRADDGLGHPVKNRSARFGSAMRTDYRKTFFKAYPHLEGDVVVHHAVEKRMASGENTNWPDIVSQSEIHSLENLRGIPKELNSEVHLSEIRREWDKFYDENPSPSKEELLNKATEIDDAYGHVFEPPVR
ncbi:DUF4157 domain-containing protein [Halovivax cerinus]|uniref:DUF4157 domain-containing protein n=1 Tax=Halovivax cerinus TaxID=1487865 RepID=A0ABD5NSZ7_9EURY|nr:DUF4157 domain-containing protein [Halovivax cerinus]